MDDLTKIDELRNRFNISYKEAVEILNESGGDLVSALIKLEEKSKAEKEEMFAKGPEMWDKVKDTVKDTSRKNIVISKDGRTVAQLPAAVGALGVVGALVSTPIALLAGVGTVAALANNYSFKLSEEAKKETTNKDDFSNTNFHQDEWPEPTETIVVEPKEEENK